MYQKIELKQKKVIMVIANPLYDVVFKRMMENDRVAKFFIGTLLDEIIETVQVRPQEFTYTNELALLAVFRLDFIATIKTAEGASKKVLIEIQKANNLHDLMRFRNYLAEHYKREDIIDNGKIILPITTIYVLGFKLPEIKTPCLKVERNYKDLSNNRNLLKRSDFVEKLTHDSYIVQATRITDRYQTRLDKLLSVFEQAYFIDNKKITKEFHHSVDEINELEDMKIMTDILHYSGTDPKEKEKIEIEQEAWRTVDAYLGNMKEKYKKNLQDYEKSLKDIEQKDKELEEEKRKIEQKDKALEAERKKTEEQDKALEKQAKQIEELLKQINKK